MSLFGCKHKSRVDTTIELLEASEARLQGNKVDIDLFRKVYLCRDCRVLFCPPDGEKVRITK